MSGSLYANFKVAALSKTIDPLTDTISVALVSSAYTPNFATDQYYSSVTGVIGTPVALTSKTLTAATVTETDGVTLTGVAVFNAANASIAAIPTGSTIHAWVLYQDTGTAGTSILIAYEPLAADVPTNGSGFTLTWDTGANKIFAL